MGAPFFLNSLREQCGLAAEDTRKVKGQLCTPIIQGGQQAQCIKYKLQYVKPLYRTNCVILLLCSDNLINGKTERLMGVPVFLNLLGEECGFAAEKIFAQ